MRKIKKKIIKFIKSYLVKLLKNLNENFAKPLEKF